MASGHNAPLPGGTAIQPGTILDGRYHILELLGRGGMGAVYKAMDRELDRLVALKVIRPELASDSSVLRRFKQELILARQVTHRNVIRIFDLGTADGVKFISMDYIEGRDLASVLREKRRMPASEAIVIARQVAEGLAAAHAENIVHRDLKPQNVMVDGAGKITLMDFGIARSAEVSGMTRTGALMGTPAYMSPEQAKGDKADGRSDIFTLGIILYELVTGQVPFQADTLMGTLMKRCQERAKPPIELEPSLPPALNRVIMKALATDTAERYQTASELLEDLNELAAPPGERKRQPAYSGMWRRLSMALAAALAVVVCYAVWALVLRKPAGPPKTQSVLIADFDNNTGDPMFEGTIESEMARRMEQARNIVVFDRRAAREVAGQLKPGSTRLDAELVKLVAGREGIDYVLTGSVSRRGDEFQVAVNVLEGSNGSLVVNRTETARNRDEVLGTMARIAGPVRKSLGDATPPGETYSTSSLTAAHSYQMAQQEQIKGNLGSARDFYRKAIEADREFGRAYAGLATLEVAANHPVEAERYFQQAMQHIQRMTDREKLRTRGGYYLTIRNDQKAVDEYTQLVTQYPLDTGGMANLALAHLYRRQMKPALEYGRKALEISQRSVLHRSNLALYALYSGDFEAAQREARGVLQQNPRWERAYVAVALSELASRHPEKAADWYNRLATQSNQGASFAAAGLADTAMFQGLPDVAEKHLIAGIAADTRNKETDYLAAKRIALAYVNWTRGLPGPAQQILNAVLPETKDATQKFLAARLYVELGQPDKAAALAAELSGLLGPEPRAYARLIEAGLLARDGKTGAAIEKAQEAQKLVDTWIGRLDLGRFYLQGSAFTEASSEFELCVKRHGEATSLALDELPTYQFFPQVQYYLGRAAEGLKSKGAAEAYQKFLAMKDPASREPMVLDARQRVAAP